MSKFFALMLVTTVLGAASALAASRPVDSLHDLPSRWEGVAGDLLHKSTAAFTIDKVIKVTRDDKVSGVTKYEVQAALVLGERRLNVRQITLLRFSTDNPALEVNLETDDELATNVFGTITYDEASDTFTLRELPRFGERRFLLTGTARH